jgi:hypothetical protein
MTKEEIDFLLAEFNSAWNMVRELDNRRGDFLKYYTGIVTAALAIPLGVIAASKANDLYVCLGSSVLLIFTLLAGQTIRYVLESERRANIRYRQKLNLIRELFISSSVSPEIVRYRGDISHRKGLGTLLFSDPEQPKGSGETLPNIYTLIRLQQLAILLALLAIWLYWFWGPPPSIAV